MFKIDQVFHGHVQAPRLCALRMVTPKWYIGRPRVAACKSNLYFARACLVLLVYAQQAATPKMTLRSF
jgi:hypothetical protein